MEAFVCRHDAGYGFSVVDLSSRVRIRVETERRQSQSRNNRIERNNKWIESDNYWIGTEPGKPFHI